MATNMDPRRRRTIGDVRRIFEVWDFNVPHKHQSSTTLDLAFAVLYPSSPDLERPRYFAYQVWCYMIEGIERILARCGCAFLARSRGHITGYLRGGLRRPIQRLPEWLGGYASIEEASAFGLGRIDERGNLRLDLRERREGFGDGDEERL